MNMNVENARIVLPTLLKEPSIIASLTSLTGLISPPKIRYLTLLEEAKPEVIWSGWDKLYESDEGVERARPILIIVYAHGGITIWERKFELKSLTQILNLQNLDSILDAEQEKVLESGIGEIVGVVVLNEKGRDPALAILATKNSTHLLIYSLSTHRFTHIQRIAATTCHRIAIKGSFLVISTILPSPSLLILDSTTFLPLPFSPITDVSPSGFPGFDLSPSGRFLAFSTTSSIPSPHSSSSPPEMGEGIKAASTGLFTESSGLGSVKIVSEMVINSVEYLMTKTRSTSTSIAMVTEESAMGNNAGNGKGLSKSAPDGIGVGRGFGERRISAGRRSGVERKRKGIDETVRVMDLELLKREFGPKSPFKASRFSVAHFRPSLPVTFLSFSPGGDSLLCSAEGQQFDIFELRPMEGGGGEVWHRYRLIRGVTVAETMSASWSRDSRFISLVSGTGTTHIYAIHPRFGKPNLEKHFSTKVGNLDYIAPLSVTLSSIARIQSPVATSNTLPESPIVSFSSKPTESYKHLILFYPSTEKIVLHRLSLIPSAGQLASEAMSGLSALMRNRGQSTGNGKVEMGVGVLAKAEWTIERLETDVEVKEVIENRVPSKRKESSYSAQVEIETFSHLLMPKSIYLSSQFEFYALASPLTHSSTAIRLGKKLEVRESVKGGENLMNSNSNLLTAFQEMPLPTISSPSFPTFPNGWGGKSSGNSWRESFQVRNLPIPSLDPVRSRLEKMKGGFKGSRSFESSSISFEEEDTIFTGSVESRVNSEFTSEEEEVEGCGLEGGWGLEGEEGECHLEEEFEFDDFGETGVSGVKRKERGENDGFVEGKLEEEGGEKKAEGGSQRKLKQN